MQLAFGGGRGGVVRWDGALNLLDLRLSPGSARIELNWMTTS